MKIFIFWALLFASSNANANDWEKFYRSQPMTDRLIDSNEPPELAYTTGSPENDLSEMWRKGYALIGITSFNTNNDSIKDGLRFAKKLKAKYIIVQTNLTSSSTTDIPITTPTSDTTYTNGNISTSGSSGYASGSYSETTTTTGTSTTYIPMTVNRFDKSALYFKEYSKIGSGVLTRPRGQRVSTI